jgi:hypothetical protein
VLEQAAKIASIGSGWECLQSASPSTSRPYNFVTRDARIYAAFNTLNLRRALKEAQAQLAALLAK